MADCIFCYVFEKYLYIIAKILKLLILKNLYISYQCRVNVFLIKKKPILLILMFSLVQPVKFLFNIGANPRRTSKSSTFLSSIFEPPRGKTNNVVSDQVRHKPACTVTEKS